MEKQFEEMEMLERIFYMQNLFDSDLIKNRNLEFSKEEWIQKEVLAIVSELAELLAEVNFKWWKNPKPVNDDNVKDELVDILHFSPRRAFTVVWTRRNFTKDICVKTRKISTVSTAKAKNTATNLTKCDGKCDFYLR